jgi:mRNA interferase RelE/StbE
VVIDRKVLKFFSELPEKSQRLIKGKCHALAEDPFPGQGGDKELLHLEFKFYRLHVGRSFTVFYQICEEEQPVKILEIVTIEKAHKPYKHFERRSMRIMPPEGRSAPARGSQEGREAASRSRGGSGGGRGPQAPGQTR